MGPPPPATGIDASMATVPLPSACGWSISWRGEVRVCPVAPMLTLRSIQRRSPATRDRARATTTAISASSAPYDKHIDVVLRSTPTVGEGYGAFRASGEGGVD